MVLTLTKLGKFGNRTFITGVILVIISVYLTRIGYDGWAAELVDEAFGAGILVAIVGGWAILSRGKK